MYKSQIQKNKKDQNLKYLKEKIQNQNQSTLENIKSSNKKKLSLNRNFVQKTFSDFTEDSSNSNLQEEITPSNRKILLKMTNEEIENSFSFDLDCEEDFICQDKIKQKESKRLIQNQILKFSSVKESINEIERFELDLEKLIDDFYIVFPIKIAEDNFVPDLVYNEKELNMKRFKQDILPFVLDKIQQKKIVKTHKILDFICTQILDQEKNLQQSKFYHIALLRPQIDYRKNVKGFEVFKKCNPNSFEFYYILQINDFYLKEKQTLENKNVFEVIPKLYIIKTYYPLSNFFQKLLHSFYRQILQEKLDVLVSLKELNQDQRKLVSFINSINILPQEKKMIKKLIESSSYFQMQKSIDSIFEMKLQNEIICQNMPPLNQLYFQESVHYFEEIISLIPFEEMMLLIFGMIYEYTIILVSNKSNILSGMISFLRNIVYPFSWKYPVIYDMPVEFLDLLESPVPLLAGINISSDEFYRKYLNKISSLKRKQSIFWFQNMKIMYFDFEILDNIKIPEINNFLKKIKKLYIKNLNPLQSKFLKIYEGDSLKKNNQKNFKITNIDSVKKKLQQAKQNKINRNTSMLELIKKWNFKSSDYFKKIEIYQLFKDLFEKDIIEKINQNHQQNFTSADSIKEIELGLITNNVRDTLFLKDFFTTQMFVDYFENNFVPKITSLENINQIQQVILYNIMNDIKQKLNYEDHERMQKMIKIWDREIDQRQNEIALIEKVVKNQNQISRQSKQSNKLKNEFLLKINSQSNKISFIEDFISNLLTNKTNILEEMKGLTDQMQKLNRIKENVINSIQGIIQIQEIKNKEIKFYEKKQFLETVEDDKKNFIIKNMRTKKNVSRISLNKSIEQSNVIFREGQKYEQQVKQVISKILRSPKVNTKQSFSKNLLNNLGQIDTNEYDKKNQIQKLANQIIKNEELERKTINLEKYRNQLFFQETELLRKRQNSKFVKNNFQRSKTATQINDTRSEGNFLKTYKFEKTVNNFNDFNNAKTITHIDFENRSYQGRNPQYITQNSQFNRTNDIQVNNNNISNINKTEHINKYIIQETIKSKIPDNDVINLQKNLELKQTQLQMQNDLNQQLQNRLTQVLKENELKKLKKETDDQYNETKSNIQQIDFSKIQIDSDFTKKQLDILKKQLDYYKEENKKLKPLKGYDELVAKLQEDNEKLNEKIFRKQQTIKSLSYQNNNLKNQLNQNDQNKNNKDNKISQFEKIIQNQKNEIEVQKIDFNDAKQNFQEKIKELIYDNDQLDKRNRQLQAQLELLQEQFEKIKNQNINFSKTTNEKQTYYKNLLEEFQKQIGELKLLSKNQQMEIKSKDKQIHSMDNKIDQFESQIQQIIENHKTEINQYIFNYEVLNKKYTEKLSTMDQLDVLNRNQDDEMQSMRVKIAEFKSQIDTLLKEKEILIQQYEEKGHFLVQTNENLEDQLKEQQDDNQRIIKEKNEKLLLLNGEIQDLKQQLLEYQEQVENLNNQHEFKEVQLGEFQNENQKLNAFKEQLEEEFNGEINKRNNIILELQNDMRQLEQKFQELLKDFATIEEENQKLNYMITNHKKEKEKIQSEKNQLELTIENLELNHKHQLLQEQFKVENLNQKYDTLKNRFKNLEIDFERSKSKDAILESLKKENHETKIQLQQIQTQYTNIKEEFEKNEDELNSLYEENQNLKKNYAKETGDLQGRLQNDGIQIDTLKDDNRNFQLKCDNQKKKIQELQKKVIEFQRQQNEDQVQIGNILKELETYKQLDKENKKMIMSLKSDNLKYNVENEQLNQLQSTIQDKDMENKKLVQNIDELRAQIDELERQNNNLQESVERENETANLYKRKQTQAKSDINLKTATIKTYEEELRELQRKYDELMESYRNILSVKDKLQQENMRMEGRIKDLDTEVFKKLSIMSKLQIKCFVLSCEIERMNKNQ